MANEKPTEEQVNVFKSHFWETRFHLNAPEGNTLTRRCEALKLFKTTFIPKIFYDEYSGMCEFGEPETVYTLDGDETKYTSLTDVADAILAKRKESTVL